VMPIIAPINDAACKGCVVSKKVDLMLATRLSLSIMAKPEANSAIQQIQKARVAMLFCGTRSAVVVIVSDMSLSLFVIHTMHRLTAILSFDGWFLHLHSFAVSQANGFIHARFMPERHCSVA